LHCSHVHVVSFSQLSIDTAVVFEVIDLLKTNVFLSLLLVFSGGCKTLTLFS